MSRAPHLLLAVSAHGYGHLSQVAPVINAVRERLPNLKLTVQGAFSRELVSGRIAGDFEQINEPADVGFAMHGPTVIDWPTTLDWFRSFHRDWDAKLAAEQALLRDRRIDLVVADIPYLPIAAARAVGIPVVAYSSLNWVDTLLENRAVAEALSAEIALMREIYASADWFILPEPSIPMDWLAEFDRDNRYPVAPVSASPRDRRDELVQLLNLNPEARLVLVSLGGIPMEEALTRWPRLEGVQWLVDAEADPARPDQISIQGLNWPFPDLIGSVDLLVTKPGYGTFTEAARCGIPVLNIERTDWAESRYVIEWLKNIVPMITVVLDKVRSGAIGDEILTLLAQGRRPGIQENGVAPACELLLYLLESGDPGSNTDNEFRTGENQ